MSTINALSSFSLISCQKFNVYHLTLMVLRNQPLLYLDFLFLSQFPFPGLSSLSLVRLHFWISSTTQRDRASPIQHPISQQRPSIFYLKKYFWTEEVNYPSYPQGVYCFLSVFSQFSFAIDGNGIIISQRKNFSINLGDFFPSAKILFPSQGVPDSFSLWLWLESFWKQNGWESMREKRYRFSLDISH